MFPTTFPEVWKVRTALERPREPDLPRALERALAEAGVFQKLRPGVRIGITAGSRGISGIGTILAVTARLVERHGARPEVIAAMGSHGGGTGAGQRQVLSSLGIVPEVTGCPVITCHLTRQLEVSPEGFLVHCSQAFLDVDGILVINRIKPHTAFRGALASGLAKMLAVGVGGPAGARVAHAGGPGEMDARIRSVSAVMARSLPVLGGIGIVENGYDEVALVRGAPGHELAVLDEELLARAEKLLPRHPVSDADVLVIGQMGKEFSGTGLDPNVIGRWRVPELSEPESPQIKRIVVLRLSPGSYGNATGVGLADIITQELASRVDRWATYLNCLTTGFLTRAMLPPVMDTDLEAMGAACFSLGLGDDEPLRLVFMENTKHLETCWVSRDLLHQVQKLGGTVVGGPAPVRFDPTGRLEYPAITGFDSPADPVIP